MRVAIYAYENIYGGLHGINSGGVFDVDSMEEAEGIGREYSYDIFDSYSSFFEELPEDEDEFAELIDFNIYHIKDSVNLSVRELDAEFARNDIKDFVEMYCDKENCDE